MSANLYTDGPGVIDGVREQGHVLTFTSPPDRLSDGYGGSQDQANPARPKSGFLAKELAFRGTTTIDSIWSNSKL